MRPPKIDFRFLFYTPKSIFKETSIFFRCNYPEYLTRFLDEIKLE